jgi:hypothetical protein
MACEGEKCRYLTRIKPHVRVAHPSYTLRNSSMTSYG